MQTGLTEIIAVVDKSGSMDPMRAEIIGGYNKMLKEQRELDGDAKFTLTLFDTEYVIVHNGIPISDVPEMTEETYAPDGMTALHDAMCRSIDEVGKRLAATPEDERPERVIMVVMTDGRDNASQEYTHWQLKEKVKHQTDAYKWEFVFIGANIDAFDVGGQMGISHHNLANAHGSKKGLMAAMSVGSQAISNYRTTGSTADSSGRGVDDQYRVIHDEQGDSDSQPQ